MEDIIKLQGIFENGYGIIAKKVMKDKNLNVISKAIYSYICSYSGKGQDAFPSQKLICFDLGISKDTLSKYMKELKLQGYISVKQSKEGTKFARNIYTINVVPCMISSDTESTDTETVGHGEVDTNNNSFNNNNNSNNNINNTSSNDDSVGFNEFWDLYDKKRGKSKTLAYWKKKHFTNEQVKEVLNKVRVYVRNTEKQYRKDPERYVRDNCWEDEVIVKNTGNNKSTDINLTDVV